MLSDLKLRPSYHKGEDDIARDFYLPCMERSTLYSRAVGFFSSSIYILAWPALKAFVARGGKLKILCSHVLSDIDVDALAEGYEARIDAELGARLFAEAQELLRDAQLRAPARILAALVANGTIAFRIAVLTRNTKPVERRIFHDKLGIFSDAAGNTVAFKGSMNETWNGLAADGNLESVDVYADWEDVRDKERVVREREYFETLWSRRYANVLVREFPEVARDELIREADSDWERALDALGESDPRATRQDRKPLRPHQIAVLAAWRANSRRGIVEHATGSGKTRTAMEAIRSSLAAGEVVLVIVPDRTLFRQWDALLREDLSDLEPRILRAGAGNDEWRTRGHLRAWTTPKGACRIVLATLPTAASEGFAAGFTGGDHILLVVDEVHRAGSEKFSAVLNLPVGPRLGLSATPRRAGDPQGTARLIAAFDRILDPPYTLADAIRDEHLSKYFYRVHTIGLEPDEETQWKAVTAEISRLVAMERKVDDASLRGRIRMSLFRRADIVKNAKGKVQLAVSVLSEHYVRGQRWLVYCDDLQQLRNVVNALAGIGIAALEYHSEMQGDRKQTLEWIDEVGGVVVAVKCLDEGVDIPSVSHALILASSRNPREYIQRRGRVLRPHAQKAMAFVHDAIVVPATAQNENPDPIVAGELSRAIEFGRAAANPSAIADLERIAIDWGIDWETLASEGIEDDDQNDGSD